MENSVQETITTWQNTQRSSALSQSLGDPEYHHDFLDCHV
jgi:hypothetical protein